MGEKQAYGHWQPQGKGQVISKQIIVLRDNGSTSLWVGGGIMATYVELQLTYLALLKLTYREYIYITLLEPPWVVNAWETTIKS